jgi:hypothetical protein
VGNDSFERALLSDDAPVIILTVGTISAGMMRDGTVLFRHSDGDLRDEPAFLLQMIGDALCAAEAVLNDRTMVQFAEGGR